jgi:hypothetical protein
MNAARIRALAIVGVLLVSAVVVAKIALSDDTQTHASYSDSCSSNAIKVVTNPLPDYPQINLKIYNGSKVPGRAQDIALQLRHRGFVVQDVGKHDDKPTISDIADIYFGPNTLGAAWVVRAEFLLADPTQPQGMHFSLTNKSKVVQVVVGTGYRQLGAKTEVNQAVAALGTPPAPPGTCIDNSAKS